MPKGERTRRDWSDHPYRRQNSAPELRPRIRGDVDPRNIIQGGTGLRSQHLRDLTPRPARYRGRNDSELNFPSGYGERSAVPRGAMPPAVSQRLNERTLNEPSSSSSIARSVRSLTEEGKTELQANNASRNHILADSRIRVILDKVRTARSGQRDGLTIEQRTAVCRFIEAMTEESGEQRFDELEKAYDEADKQLLHANANLKTVYDSIANGVGNIRYGDARTNGDVSNAADYDVMDNRLTARSDRVRNAVLELSRNGLIGHGDAFDSLGVPREKGTNLDVTSSATSSSGLSTTGVRARIDPFEAPVSDERFQRRHSFTASGPPPLDLLSGSETYQAPYQDWHHTSRSTERKKQAENETQLRPS